MLEEKKQLVSVNKTLTIEEEKDKQQLAISSCRDKNNKAFWLIHKMDKVVIPQQSETIDIDELNAELDALLNM
jgi:hypothetical protein